MGRGPGHGDGCAGDARRQARGADGPRHPTGGQVDVCSSTDVEGLDPAAGPAVENKTERRIDKPRLAKRGLRSRQAGGHAGDAVAATALHVGIGQVAGQACCDPLSAEAGQGRAGGRGGGAQGDAVAGGRQIDGRRQIPRLDVAASQRRSRHAGDQPHQFAVVQSRITQHADRAIVGVDAHPGALDDDDGAAAVRLRWPAGEFPDQRVQRAERQLSIAQGGAHDRPDQPHPARRHAQAPGRPGSADRIVDLDPFDGHIGVGRIADPDPGHEAVQFDPLDIHVGRDAFALQPSDQHLPGGGAAVQPEDGQQNQNDRECDEHDTKQTPSAAGGAWR